MKTSILFLTLSFIVSANSLFAQEKAGKHDTTLHITYVTFPVISNIKIDNSGRCIVCGRSLNLSVKEVMKENVINNYSCPIHPDIANNKFRLYTSSSNDIVLSAKEKMKLEVMKL